MWSFARKDDVWWWFSNHYWKLCVLAGVGWCVVAFWGAYRGNQTHAAARTAYLERCSATLPSSICEARVTQHDDGCLFASGLLARRNGQGESGYARCLDLGEPAYRAERAARAKARRLARDPARY